MRIPVLLLGLVIGAALLLGIVAFVLPPADQVVTHPEHPTLLQGTAGAPRVAAVWWVGAAFGLVQIAFFGACFALGMQRRGSLERLARPIVAGLLLYAGVFALLLASYRSYLAEPGASLVLGFPAPTAVMLYLLWPVPLWFLWLYLRHFDEHTPSEHDLERLRRIAREVAAEEERG